MVVSSPIGAIGILSRGDRRAQSPTRENSRLTLVFDALEVLGVTGVPVVYSDDAVDEIRRQLQALDGVLVWVNPIENDQDRSKLDAILRDVAEQGVWVSAHPDIILKMGTKEVLYRTRHLGWGADTRLYRSLSELREGLSSLLASGPRVLKQLRSSGGDGVWKVETALSASRFDETTVHALHALRGSVIEEMLFSDFAERMRPYFAGPGGIIDQPFQSRLGDGAIRCYLTQDQVVGFGFQLVKALMPPPPSEAGISGAEIPPRLYYGPEKPEFQSLKATLESEWVPQMRQILGIDVNSLPALWDADFLLGPKNSAGEDTYVLGEINVQSVFPFPDDAAEPVAKTAAARMLDSKRMRGR